MALIRVGIRNNIFIYTVSVLIASMATSIIFLSTCTRRVYPVEIFLSRDVSLVSAMFMVSITLFICSFLFGWCACGLLFGWD